MSVLRFLMATPLDLVLTIFVFYSSIAAQAEVESNGEPFFARPPPFRQNQRTIKSTQSSFQVSNSNAPTSTNWPLTPMSACRSSPAPDGGSIRQVFLVGLPVQLQRPISFFRKAACALQPLTPTTGMPRKSSAKRARSATSNSLPPTFLPSN